MTLVIVMVCWIASDNVFHHVEQSQKGASSFQYTKFALTLWVMSWISSAMKLLTGTASLLPGYGEDGELPQMAVSAGNLANSEAAILFPLVRSKCKAVVGY